MFDLEKIKQQFSGQKNQENNNQRLIATVIAAVFVLLILIAGTSLMFFETAYKNKFYPGSRIGDINLAGLSKDEAFKIIEAKAVKIDQEAVQVKYLDQGQEKNLVLDETLSPDSARDFLDYDVYQTVYNNFNIGRSQGIVVDLFNQLRLWQGGIKMSAQMKLDQDYVKNAVKNQLADLASVEQNAAPQVTCAPSGCQVEVAAEKSGLSFNYDEALKTWANGLADFYNYPITLKQVATEPMIKKTEVSGLIGPLQGLFNQSSTPQYFYADKKWSISKKSLAGLIKFEKNNSVLRLSVDQDNFDKWFKLNIGDQINIPAQNATIEVKNGQMAGLSTQRNGQEADQAKAYDDLNNKIIANDFNNLIFELAVKTTTPEVAVENINDLGIKEIIGTGQSNFSGSPTNRRKNIRNGANKLHGLLIKPDEEFSLIKTLLPVDASTGYFPELVIKGNKTTPEFGGGLCQIGTTIFRSALASGLPILERQNHSYSVTYYLEGGLPGVDATIYDPKPDLRFKNDTGNYILIQARISGDNLYFDFWGTKDGRTATKTKPKTWGVKSPPPTKIVESTDLAPGEKKCTEKPHKGISAAFDYIVGYPDGHTATTTFTSVYKPWQEVCLVGVSPSSSPAVSVDKP